MNRHTPPYKILLIGLVVVLWQSCSPIERQPTRPNVLLILADDQGWGDVGAHGNDIIETPTLGVRQFCKTFELADSTNKIIRFSH